jgi:hypothetical protein
LKGTSLYMSILAAIYETTGSNAYFVCNVFVILELYRINPIFQKQCEYRFCDEMMPILSSSVL